MKRRNFLASLLALPFVAKAAEPLKPFARRQMVVEEVCPTCGQQGGEPVNFYPWNDKSLPPLRACTFCQNYALDNEPHGVVTIMAGEDLELGDNVCIGPDGRAYGFDRKNTYLQVGYVTGKEFRMEMATFKRFTQIPFPRKATLYVQVYLT